MKLQLLSVKKREGDVTEFAFKPPEDFTWIAGQYMHYVLPHDNADDRGIERWFTISGAPSEGEVRITTRINHEHSSTFKAALQLLKPGDEIEADGPEGDFVLHDPSKNYLFIAGGIGITPIRSILTEAAAQGMQLNATVLYANRSQDIPFRDQLDELDTQNPNLKVNYIVEPEHLDQTILSSTITAIDDPVIYISGPKPMVESIAAIVKSLGQEPLTDDFPGYESI